MAGASKPVGVSNYLGRRMETRFPHLTALLTGLAEQYRPDPLEPLCRSLAEQIKRRGPGSHIAAAKLEGIRCAQLRGQP